MNRTIDLPAHLRWIALLATVLLCLSACGRRHDVIPTVPPSADLVRYARIIDEQGSINRVAPALITAIIAVESGGNARATSRSGSMGLMQLKPATAARYGITNLYDPEANISAGTQYLRDMLSRFRGDVSLALAAYHSGPSAVTRAHGIPASSRDYVGRVLAVFNAIRR